MGEAYNMHCRSFRLAAVRIAGHAKVEKIARLVVL